MELNIEIFYPSKLHIVLLVILGGKASHSRGRGVAYFYFKAEWQTLRWAEQHCETLWFSLTFPWHFMMFRGFLI